MITRPSVWLRVPFLLCALLVPPATPQAAGTSSGTLPAGGFEPHPVELTTRGLGDAQASVGQTLEFEVAVRGTRRPVSLTLQNPQPGMVFDPVHGGRPPFACKVRWNVPEGTGERVDLAFRAVAHGGGGAQTLAATLDVPILVARDAGALVRVGDLTGDGVLDVVAVARHADHNGTVNAGVAFFWEGSTTPSGTPDATFEVPGASAGDRLGDAAAPALQLVDLTDDGLLDVVITAQGADHNGIPDSGAVYIFHGSPFLSGIQGPSAILCSPAQFQNDQLGELPVQVGDLNGDVLPDLWVGSSLIDANGINTGAVFVWDGAQGIGGPPAAELVIPNPENGDRLGLASGKGVQAIDLDGDGLLELVIGARLADVQGIPNLGAIYVWQGRTDLTQLSGGPVVTLETLSTNFAAAGDQLGSTSGQGIQFADVTGDGRLDIVAGARQADADFRVDSGAIYVWEGQSSVQFLSNTPTWELYSLSAQAGDLLGDGTGQTIQFADVTGDSHLDVIAHSEGADQEEGRIYVWPGGPLLSNFPSAELVHGEAGARMGDVSGQGVFAVDMNGDGLLDILAGSRFADDGPDLDQGRIYVYDGNSGFQGGIQGPDFTLSAPNFASIGGDRLGELTGPALQFFDVTGDRVLDLITGSSVADVNGITNAGAVHVWQGGLGFGGFPLASLLDNAATDGDQLARGTGQGIRVHDLTGDGILDLIVGAERADLGSAVDAGQFHIWQGGPALSGQPTPLYTLVSDTPQSGDRLGDLAGPGILFADVTGDLVDDVLIGAQAADPNFVLNAGAVYVYNGLNLNPGTLIPDSVLVSGNPEVADQLGLATVGMVLADLTDDGVLDLLVGAQLADEQDTNSGAVYFWTGGGFGIGVDPFPFPDATFSDPNASPGDTLGG